MSSYQRICWWWNNNNAVNTIDYVTISSTGKCTDFGDLPARQEEKVQELQQHRTTRGISAGGDMTLLKLNIEIY